MINGKTFVANYDIIMCREKEYMNFDLASSDAIERIEFLKDGFILLSKIYQEFFFEERGAIKLENVLEEEKMNFVVCHRIEC